MKTALDDLDGAKYLTAPFCWNHQNSSKRREGAVAPTALQLRGAILRGKGEARVEDDRTRTNRLGCDR